MRWQADYQRRNRSGQSIAIQQSIQGNAVVHVVAVPTRHTSVMVDVKPRRSVRLNEVVGVSAEIFRWVTVEQCPGRLSEVKFAVVADFQAESSFMHQPMMVATQLHQILDVGLATVGPVCDMVGIDKAGMGAAREAATAIAVFQCPMQCQ